MAGILQNQPLGMAKNLVELIDLHMHQEKRFYLFVSPHAKDPIANDSFHAASADYLHLLKRLMEVLLGQSGFQDWITAKGVNQRVALLDARAAGLKNAILLKEIDVPALAKTADSLLQLFFPKDEHLSPGARGPETLIQAQTRIADQYEAEMTALGGVAGQLPSSVRPSRRHLRRERPPPLPLSPLSDPAGDPVGPAQPGAVPAPRTHPCRVATHRGNPQRHRSRTAHAAGQTPALRALAATRGRAVEMTEDKDPQPQERGFFSSLESAKNKGALSTFPPPRLRLLDWFRI
jgi:hypothetical protein